MNDGTAGPAQRVELQHALHITRGAFRDAMREQGLLPGLIQLVDVRAEQILDEVLGEEEQPPAAGEDNGPSTPQERP